MSINSPTDLRLILEVPADVSDPALQVFLDDANLIVTENLGGKGLSDARIKSIEKYLAGHYALVLTERGGLSASKTGDSMDQYLNLSTRTNADREGFQLTRYGQQALTLDTSGTLLAMSKQTLTAQFRVSGGESHNPRSC